MAQLRQTKGKKVVHITTVHSPLDVRIFHKQCRSLAKEGFEVHLIAPGCDEKIIDGVFLHGVQRAAWGRLGRMTVGVHAVYARAQSLDADVYHFHDPELLPMGLLLKLRGKRVIYDAHEDVPRQILSKFWIFRPARRLVSWLFEKVENFIARRLDAVVAATPFIRDRFLSLGCRSLDINNYPLLAEFTKRNNDSRAKERAVCYMGVINEIRGIVEMIGAVEQSDVTLLLAGQFEDEGERERAKKLRGWSLVEEYGQVDREGVAALMSRSIAGLVVLHPTENYLVSLPIKMFEYMAAGIPVIASDFPLWRQIIEDNGCGLCVKPLESTSIADAIRTVLAYPDDAALMGRNGRKMIEKKFNWENESWKLVDLYAKVMYD